MNHKFIHIRGRFGKVQQLTMNYFFDELTTVISENSCDRYIKSKE
jgi:hypothetical protein